MLSTIGDMQIVDEPADFIRSTVELLTDANERLPLGTKARELAVEQYSCERIGKVLDAVYQDVGGSAG